MQSQQARPIKAASVRVDAPALRAGWSAGAILAGFPATIVMLLLFVAAFLLALLASGVLPADQPGTRLVGLWLHNLTHNRPIEAARVDIFTAALLHLLAGFLWAVLYALVAEPRLSGPGWLRGAKFSIVPGILSLVVFLPLVGGGPFGLALGAGPLPVIGNLLLHLAYGTILGYLYGPFGDLDAGTLQPPSSGAQLAAIRWSERMAARGLLAGLVLGVGLGILGPLAVSLLAGGPPTVHPVLLLLGAVLGPACGGVIGSFVGLSGPSEPHQLT